MGVIEVIKKIFAKINNTKESKNTDTDYENKILENKGYLSEDVKFNNIEPFDYDPVYNGLPAYDYNTGKRLK